MTVAFLGYGYWLVYRSSTRARADGAACARPLPNRIVKTIARYIGRHGTKRVAKAVLIGAAPPTMLKSEANPGGTPLAAFDGIRAGVLADRSQLWKDLSMAFYGYNRPGAKISEGVRESFWLQA